MKKFLIAVALFSLVASRPAQAESAYDRVMRTGVIRCGFGISPPVLVQDPNTKALSGLDYDIWQEIGKELDLKIQFTEEAGWGNFIEGLKTGRYDAFCSELWADPPRTKFTTLTQPVLYSFVKAFVRAGDHRFDGDLEKINAPGVTIPVVDGDVSVKVAQSRFPRAKLYVLPQTATVSDMFMAVKSKKADVIFLDQGMVSGLEKADPGILQPVAKVPPPFVFASYFALRSGETQLRDMIDVALQKIIDDGRLEKMAKKYSPDYVMPKKGY